MISEFNPKNTPAEDRLIIVRKRAVDAAASCLNWKKHEIMTEISHSVPYLVRSFRNSKLGCETA